ncbi:MAG TPA: phosphopantetheine-binding protein, partial [Longimicrobium sp.]|nr:phosphopantetheine-binding protein [Longimicrobium sp.]
ALSRHPAVAECAVVAREDAPGEKRLVAYAVGDIDGDALRSHLRGSLPDFMVPSAFVILERLPLTANGKVDRAALPRPELAPQRFVEPRTRTERALAAIWADVLRLPRVGAEDDFFALGGHSLLATRVVSRIREELEVELPLRAMFEAPALERLAERIEAAAPRRTAAIVAADRGAYRVRLDPASPPRVPG